MKSLATWINLVSVSLEVEFAENLTKLKSYSISEQPFESKWYLEQFQISAH